jgi:hypothetical protein
MENVEPMDGDESPVGDATAAAGDAEEEDAGSENSAALVSIILISYLFQQKHFSFSPSNNNTYRMPMKMAAPAQGGM